MLTLSYEFKIFKIKKINGFLTLGNHALIWVCAALHWENKLKLTHKSKLSWKCKRNDFLQSQKSSHFSSLSDQVTKKKSMFNAQAIIEFSSENINSAKRQVFVQGAKCHRLWKKVLQMRQTCWRSHGGKWRKRFSW